MKAYGWRETEKNDLEVYYDNLILGLTPEQVGTWAVRNAQKGDLIRVVTILAGKIHHMLGSDARERFQGSVNVELIADNRAPLLWKIRE